MKREQLNNPEIQTALEAFDPRSFGFEPYGPGWKKDIPGFGPLAICPVSWEHAQQQPQKPDEPDTLSLVVKLQEQVWGMDPIDVVPTNILAIIPATGGSTLTAYNPDHGFDQQNWLGFLIGLGSSEGTLVSHMMGVRPDLRGKADIGFYLKIIQAYEALKTGHTSIEWTYDPARGANAKLNLGKLGGTCNKYTLNKYGKLHTELYGDVPTDRFTVTWNLTSERVQNQVHLVASGESTSFSLETAQMLPLASPENLSQIAKERPFQLALPVPGDIDTLNNSDPEQAIAWRRNTREVLSVLMNTESAGGTNTTIQDPANLAVTTSHGEYSVVNFATGMKDGTRKSYYILERK